MLQVALAPAAVAQDMIDKCWRGFLVRAADAGEDAYAPPGAAQETRFDKVMAHDELVFTPGE